MPRIRKKTSKRTTTHQRTKLKHKVAEGRKKAKKAAAKNPQWKSKQKKDPGIPNNFPFKDQVLAEVAEARRKSAEEKQRRKDEAKKAKATLKGAAQPDEASADEYDDAPTTEQEQQETGILTVDSSSKALSSKPPKSSKRKQAENDEDEVPTLSDPTLTDLAVALERADALVAVLDARDPLPCRSTKIEAMGKPVVYVLTKTDLAPRESVAAWASSLRASGLSSVLLFRAASAFIPAQASDTSKGKQKASVSSTADALGADALLKVLSALNAKTVAVVGPANVGKSALINSLAHKAASPVYDLTTSTPGHSTTGRPIAVAVGEMTFLDTAGYSPLYGDAETEDVERAKDMLLRSRGRIDRVKEPLPALEQLVPRAPAEDLMLLYNLPAFAGGSTTAFLTSLARARNCMMKDSTPDHAAAARIVLKDWHTGAFPWYTQPPPTDVPASSPEDAAVLEACLPRKDLRRAKGSLVRLAPGLPDEREIDTHAVPAAGALAPGEAEVRERAPKRVKISSAEEDNEDDEEDDAEMTDGDSEGDDDEDGDDAEEDMSGYESDNNDVPTASVGSKKRQRKEAAAASGKGKKKVSFAPAPSSKGPQRVANAGGAKASKKGSSTGKGDAYDFGKFFK